MPICQKRGVKNLSSMVKVSVIVLNWNGKQYLQDCLKSLSKITYKNLEIIVVDNNSSDGSVAFVKKSFPHIRIIENKKNYGFAKGNNIGFAVSKGEYVLILNNDTKVTPDFFSPLLEDFKKNSDIGCLQPQIRILEHEKLLDGVGAYLTFTGFLYHFGYLKDRSQKKYTTKKEIFSAKGAAMLLRRSAIEKVGLFDEDFFIFFEETDLCFRLWLAGYKVVYEPKSVLYHVGGGDTTSSDSYKYEKRMYLSFRNMMCCYLKNFGTKNMMEILPVFMVLQLGLLVYYGVTFRFRLVLILVRANYWNILHLPSTIKKRKKVQKTIRKISDNELNNHILVNPKISYYFSLLTGSLKNYRD